MALTVMLQQINFVLHHVILFKHSAIDTYGRVEVVLHAILTSTLDGR
jgi:hypothetical protein